MGDFLLLLFSSADFESEAKKAGSRLAPSSIFAAHLSSPLLAQYEREERKGKKMSLSKTFRSQILAGLVHGPSPVCLAFEVAAARSFAIDALLWPFISNRARPRRRQSALFSASLAVGVCFSLSLRLASGLIKWKR